MQEKHQPPQLPYFEKRLPAVQEIVKVHRQREYQTRTEVEKQVRKIESKVKHVYPFPDPSEEFLASGQKTVVYNPVYPILREKPSSIGRCPSDCMRTVLELIP